MPKTNKIYYNFHTSYQQDWLRFIAQFPKADELEEGSITAEIKASVYELDIVIQLLYSVTHDYSGQMEMRWAWRKLVSLFEEDESIYEAPTHSWFIAQIINMINCDNPEIVKSTWYAISVDYFECGMDGSWMFPIMYYELDEADMAQLIIYSISIPWTGKAETYRQMIQNKAHHAMLADALYHSCKAYCYTSAKASEALEILNQLTVSETLYDQAFEILTTPIPVKFKEAIELAEVSKDGITGFVSIVLASSDTETPPTWFPYAELWIGDTHIGTFEEDTYNLEWTGWDSVNSRYGIATPEKKGHQEHVLCVKIPFQKGWRNKTGLLKPI
jgi:hypothetical protein